MFHRSAEIAAPEQIIGIPRCLNMYEEYPFWHTLFYASENVSENITIDMYIRDI